MSPPSILPMSGRWIRRGREIVLLPGGVFAGGSEIESEGAPAPAGELIHHPRLGWGRRRRRGGPERELEGMAWLAGAGPELEEIIGNGDTRRRVEPTTGVPYRWICNLTLVFGTPGDPAALDEFTGSGTLISDRHVLTAAHNLHNTLGDSVLHTVRTVRVRPGLNRRRAPFGESVSAKVRVAPAWDGVSDAADFGLITLADDLGAQRHASLGRRPLGFWGSPDRGAFTRIRPLKDEVLRGAEVNVCGYPGDKCGNRPARGSATRAQLAGCDPALQGSTQWRAFGRVTGPLLPALLTYDMDTAGGQSGSPVWLRWKGFRTLVAVHGGKLDDPARSGVTAVNEGVRITDAVLAQLRAWMREDGVTAAF